MLNQSEIMQTIRMIDQQHLDVRTITMGISLLSCAHSDIKIACDKVYDKITRYAEKLVATGEAIEKEFGINVGKQLNVMTGMAASGTVVGTSHNDRGIMSDEEYYRRYGHPRGVRVANFLRGAK